MEFLILNHELMENHTGCPKSIDQLVNALKGDTQENYESTPYNSQYFEYKPYSSI